MSIHQADAFPGSGYHEEIGTGAGRGYNLNAPLMSGATIADYDLIFRDVFVPAIERMNPEVVIVSSGQDVLFDDPLAGMNLFPEDLGRLTSLLLGAVRVPRTFVLEGGYGPAHGAAMGEIAAVLEGSRTFSPLTAPPRESSVHLAGYLKQAAGLVAGT
jgi:acetoin utilization deacetylase AcuC-like enzyme